MDANTKRKLMALKNGIVGKAVIVSNYASDNHTLNSMGERRNATHIESTIWDLARLVELLLEEAETK